MEKKRYGAIDGLRMIAAFGIVMRHMQANNNYEIGGFVYDTIIPSLTDFVFLFMVVSAFGMCCGYRDKVLANQLNLTDFYSKRYKKILPFFGILVLLDVVMSHSVSSIYEGFADLTLLFGFLPNTITVIGVGWFIGLIFIFYLIFPFFCVLLENKKRAWAAFGISLIYNFACVNYFDVGRTNILYSGCFFIAGGLIYLYREEISRVSQWAAWMLAICCAVLYYCIGGNTCTYLMVSCSLLICAVTNSGGYWRTELQSSSAASAWRFTSRICLSSV
ncbi:MAG: acyltransferase family protein [bacterium]|nr:acyltransferase family protein [bacterium]